MVHVTAPTAGLETVVRGGTGVEGVLALGISFDVAKLTYVSPKPAASFLLPETTTPEATLVVPGCALTRDILGDEVAR